MNFNADTLAKLREATGLLQTQGPMAATAAIQRALQGMPMPGGFETPQSWTQPAAAPEAMRDINPRPETPASETAPRSNILERFKKAFRGMTDVADADIVEPAADEQAPGRFIAAAYANGSGRRAYKLYIPSTREAANAAPAPLIVMLHGCKQNPDDFAAGTQMNRLAEEHGCLVLYPAQAKNANGSNCWNWFQTADQQRDRGEPAVLAGMIEEVVRTHGLDGSRVYVAGLSAGGAMAAVLAHTYPELVAAVGIHSGLPYGAAHDVVSAFAAMKNGMPADKQAAGTQGSSIPVIVFHGDRDATVHPRNGDQALAQCLRGDTPKASRGEDRHKKKVVDKGAVPNGRSYTKETRFNDEGQPVAEQWIVHGAGHAWSGGSRSGSYTDPQGPHASREMLRFFLAQKKQNAA